jgi:hypothetical protein
MPRKSQLPVETCLELFGFLTLTSKNDKEGSVLFLFGSQFQVLDGEIYLRCSGVRKTHVLSWTQLIQCCEVCLKVQKQTADYRQKNHEQSNSMWAVKDQKSGLRTPNGVILDSLSKVGWPAATPATNEQRTDGETAFMMATHRLNHESTASHWMQNSTREIVRMTTC